MATVKFLYRSTKDIGPVTVRFSHLKEIDIFTSSGYQSQKRYWFDSKKKMRMFPVSKEENAKKEATVLTALEQHIIQSFNKDYNSGVVIDKDWLESEIDVFFNRKSKKNTHSDFLLDNIDYLIKNAPYRKNSKGGVGVSKSRISDYETCKRLLEEFSKANKKKYKVKDVTESFSRDFEKWFVEEKGLSLNYAKRNLNVIKAACKEAAINGIETSLSLTKISTATSKNEYIIYLNESDLQKIRDFKFDNARLNNAKKWILLGCELGQRGNDLINITERNIIYSNGKKYFELKQEKTGKVLNIPIHEKISTIISDGLPKKVSLQKLNDAIHDVCEFAGIDEVIEGEKKINNRKVKDYYPKYKLISSHSLRRSFASNYYGKISTNLLMRITGHSTERMFLNYIGKSDTDYADEFALAIKNL